MKEHITPSDGYPFCPACDELLQPHTLSEWQQIDNITILDPDGFDRTDPELETRLFTRAEWLEGQARSTCIFPAEFFTMKPENP